MTQDNMAPHNDVTTRERGTLQKTLPKSPRVTIFLYVVLCTTIAAFIFEYSLYDETKKDVVKSLLQALMGTVSTTVGLIYIQPDMFGVSFSLALAFILVSNEFSAHQQPNFTLLIQQMLPLISFLVICTSATLEKLICWPFGNPLIFNHFNLVVICTSSLAMVIAALSTIIASGKHYDMSYTPSIAACVAAFSIYHLFYVKRSHKNGGLLSVEQCGKAVVTYSCVLHFVISSTTNHEISNLAPFLLGAIIASALASLFAAVADTWYSIGTGQFFMVSLDTLGILFYFILPIIILLMRFVDKYENIIQKLLLSVSSLITTQLNLSNTSFGMDIQSQLHKCTVLLFTLSALIGIPLTQNLCPLSGHLFGQVYTHGNPNTKTSAICINFSDYTLTLKKVLEEGKQSNILNIFVSLHDLIEYPDLIKKLHDIGHTIGLRLGEKDVPYTLQEAFKNYQQVIGSEAMWYHTGIDYSGRHPSCYRAATLLNMKLVTWSTIVTSMNDTNFVGKDITKNGGGSIVYLGSSNEDILIKVLSIFKENGIIPEKLSMILNAVHNMDL